MGRIKILKASAGSGKTFMLAYEYVRCVIRRPMLYRNILAVTFTKKATGEMKGRILKELHTLTLKDGARHFMEMLITDCSMSEEQIRVSAKIALELILNDYSNFSVMTIDSFFQKIVRSFIKELHLESDYTIDFNTDYLLTLSIDNLIRRSDNDETLRGWIESYIDDRLDSSKKADIRRSMAALSKKILTEEFDKSYFEDYAKELMPFFDRMKEIRSEVLANVSGEAQKFIDYTLANDITQDLLPGGSRGVYSYMVKVSNGEMIPPSATVSKSILDISKWKKCPKEHQPTLLSILETTVNYIETNIKDFYTIDTILETHRTFVLLGDISKELNSLCSEGNKMILSNTNHLITKLVEGNDIPYIFEKVGSIYSIIMIDEFQDTSRGQWGSFRPLIENIISIAPSSESPVTLVGDIKQSIYRWRGGDWRILGEEVEQVIGREGVIEQLLATNYRSREQVINFNNQALRYCADTLNDTLNSHIEMIRQEGNLSLESASIYHNMLQRAYTSMEQTLPQNPKSGGLIEVLPYSDSENMEHLVAKIKSAQDRGYKASDIAILCRKRPEAAAVVAYLLEYKSSHPAECVGYNFDIISADGLRLKNSEVVQFIISVYRLANGEDKLWLAFYNNFLKRELTRLPNMQEMELFKELHSKPVSLSVEKIFNFYSLADKAENIPFLQALHSATMRFVDSERGDIASFIRWWDSESANLSIAFPEGHNAITVETIHKSKGLQFGVVLIPFCNWNLSPLVNSSFWGVSDNELYKLPGSTTQNMIINYKKKLYEGYFSDSYIKEYILTVIENFNILYVALTRAESELYLMMPTKKGGALAVDSLLEGYLSGRTQFGEELRVSSADVANDDISFKTLPYADSSERLIIHTESDKFFKDMESESASIDQRGRGIILHSLLERVNQLDEFDNVIEKELSSGSITKSEAEMLKTQIAEALKSDLVRSWFDSRYKVISERAMLLPNKESGALVQLRPDRVLVGDNQTIVVDYKFGAKRPSHRKQIERYIEVLSQMGYSNVCGYVWYVTQNDFTEILG